MKPFADTWRPPTEQTALLLSERGLTPANCLGPNATRFRTFAGPFRTACHRCKARRPAGMGSDDSRQQSGRGRSSSHSVHGQRGVQPMSKRTRHAYNSGHGIAGETASSSAAHTIDSGSSNSYPLSRSDWRGDESRSSEPSGGLLLAGGGTRDGRDNA